MDARVFISRRSSDGADKAAALAHDLEALFGDGQIDVEGMGPPPPPAPDADGTTPPRLTPMLLVLVTPDYFGATDGDGQRCMDQADDIARLELESAILAGWRLLPLLCDGVVAMPPVTELPPPFDRLPSLPWRRLSTDDWRADIARIADDLRHLGLVPRDVGPHGAVPLRPPVEGPVTTPMALQGETDERDAASKDSSSRRRVLGVLGIGVLLVGGLLAARRQRGAIETGGDWNGRVGRRGEPTSDNGAPMFAALQVKGRTVRLTGTLSIADDPQWDAVREAGKRRTGGDLQQLLFKGQGELFDDAVGSTVSMPRDTAQPNGPESRTLRRMELTVSFVAPDSAGTELDSGTLSALLDVRGGRVHGLLRLASEQVERVVDVLRS